ncbi:MAG: AMP-binding protein [Lachnospiraceae bacterium]|nr:AMP-binding protein [Lachnospiraceae bacterium]MDD3616676.1 AMP-binding protein [Lachnospiraceae bacterium]
MKKCNIDQWICETEHIKSLTRASLEKIQLEKLNLLLARKKTLLSSLEELAQLPFTTSEMLSQHPEQFLLTSQANINRVISGATSGTTGPSKRVFYTAKDTSYTTSFFAAGISEMVTANDRVLIDFPFSGAFGLGDLIEKAVISIGAHSIRPCPNRSFKEQCLYIHEQQPDCYIGSCVPLLSLARYYQCHFADWSFPITRALISGDACPSEVVRELEQLLHTKLFPHYGSRECGLGGAITCQAHEGMHLRENHIIAEIIDRDLKPVPDGCWGELVLSTIGLEAMPLIRYRTGDYTRILPTPCPCGSVTRRLDSVSRVNTQPLSLPARPLTRAHTKPLSIPLTQEMLDNQLFSIPKIIDYQASLRNNILFITALLPADLHNPTDGHNPFEKVPLNTLHMPGNIKEMISDRLYYLWPTYDVQITFNYCHSDTLPFYPGKRHLL